MFLANYICYSTWSSFVVTGNLQKRENAMVTSKAASQWVSCLLLRCGDIESNPGPATTDDTKQGGEASMPKSRSRVSLSSIRSSIQRRRRELYIGEIFA